MSQPNEPKLLGPFLGYVTTSSIKIWLHFEGSHDVIYVTFHPNAPDARESTSATLQLRPENLFTDCVTIDNLTPDTRYFYKLWTNPAHSLPLPLEGLTETELNFRTLSADENAQIDFVVMSCHNPTVSQLDGFEGLLLFTLHASLFPATCPPLHESRSDSGVGV